MKKAKRADRLEGIEVLRCVLMFLVVYEHCYVTGLWAHDGGNWGNVVLSLIHWHVISFVAISGWFGVKFSVRKFLRLWTQFAFYCCLLYFLGHYSGESYFNWKCYLHAGGWFVPAYLMLLLCASFLNAGAEKLIEGGGAYCWKCWGLVMLGYILNWLPFHAFTGVSFATDSVLSFLTVAFVYVTARLMFLSKVPREKWGVWLGLAVCSLSLYVFSMCVLYKILNPKVNRLMCYYLSYENPFVWAVGLLVVGSVVSLRSFPQWLGKIAVFISPSLFGVLLFHHGTPFGQNLYVPFQRWLSECTAFHPFIVVLLSAIHAFLICLVVDLLRRLLFASISKVFRMGGLSR